MAPPVNEKFPWVNRPGEGRLLTGQIRPRFGSLLVDKQWLLVMPVAVLFYILLSNRFARHLAIKDLALAQLTVASLSFGACVTGTVLSLTLNPERAAVWAVTRRNADSKFSNLSDLVFVFVWSALCQLAVAFSAFVSLSIGSGYFVWQPGEPPSHRILLAFAIFVASYAFFQLLAVVRTLTQIGVVTIASFTQSHINLTDETYDRETNNTGNQGLDG